MGGGVSQLPAYQRARERGLAEARRVREERHERRAGFRPAFASEREPAQARPAPLRHALYGRGVRGEGEALDGAVELRED